MGDIRIHIAARGLDDMIQAMRDIQKNGIPRAQRALDGALDRTAERSYGLAHIHDGALRASQSHSSTHGPNWWTGQVSYDARGAAFEVQRGGNHGAFIDSLAASSEPDFKQAIDSAFEGL